MTEAQDSLHWRRWSAVCKANGWRMAKGRLVDEAARTRLVSRFHEQTWAAAERLALAEHRAVTVNDLRHGSYAAAAGKTSHSTLTNKEFNRVLTWWKVLVNPDDLSAMMEWDSPEIAERRGLVQMIRNNSGPGYAEAISARKHGTEFYEDLPIADLRKLSMTISEQRRKRNWKAELRAEPAGQLVEDPF